MFLREGLVLDCDEVLVFLVQDQDIQVAPLSDDDVLLLLVDLGGAPICGEQLWWSLCGVEEGGGEVLGLPVVR